jgi:rhodanese-related sulfurtransferase
MPWAMLTSAPKITEVGIDVAANRPDGALLLDVREPEEYACGHIPGALNLPQADLASRLAEIPRDRPVYVACKGGFRSLRAAQFLAQSGIENVLSVKGGTDAWRAAGKPLAVGETDATQPRIKETDWAHAGGYDYDI